jgi:hypothetical protein
MIDPDPPLLAAPVVISTLPEPEVPEPVTIRISPDTPVSLLPVEISTSPPEAPVLLPAEI